MKKIKFVAGFKSVCIIIPICLAASCGKDTGKVGKALVRDFNTVCIDGVEYLVKEGTKHNNRLGFMAPHFKPDGTLYTCKAVKSE